MDDGAIDAYVDAAAAALGFELEHEQHERVRLVLRRVAAFAADLEAVELDNGDEIAGAGAA